jgi:hypothetical protein
LYPFPCLIYSRALGLYSNTDSISPFPACEGFFHPTHI